MLWPATICSENRRETKSRCWFFLMTHGNRVEPEVGQAIAWGPRDQRVTLPDRDARVLLRWAERPYGF